MDLSQNFQMFPGVLGASAAVVNPMAFRIFTGAIHYDLLLSSAGLIYALSVPAVGRASRKAEKS